MDCRVTYPVFVRPDQQSITKTMPPPAAEPAPSSFRDLARQIADMHLPSFGMSLQAVVQATESDALSGHQIAEVILHDPALTSHVLRAANAAYLGYGGNGRIVTISRAVVVLGVQAIRAISISALTIEAMGANGRFAPRVQDALGRALHAAVQARDMGLRRRLSRDAAERLFVEALLGSVGEMAFWCFAGDYAERLDVALKAGQPQAEAEHGILGTTLQQLGRDLLQAWNLGTIIQNSKEVELAIKLSLATQQGWESSGAQRATKNIGTLLKQEEDETLARLKHNAEEAINLTMVLGAPKALAYIASPPGQAATTPVLAAEELAPNAQATPYPEPNLQLQLRTLTEMGKVATSRKDLPMLLETCLEGLHRAVALDRCVLCLLTPTRTQLLARMATGHGTGELRKHLVWHASAELDALLKPQSTHWFTENTPAPVFVTQSTGSSHCFIAAFTVDHQVIGLFYADRQPSGRELDAEAFEGFRSFVAQAEMVVRALPR